MELVIRRPWHLTLLPMHWHILFCKTAWRHWDCAVNCMRVSDCPLNSLTSDQNCFGVGSWRFEDGVLDFKCSVLSCSHVKCSSEVVNPSVWFFGLSGIWRAWDCFLAWCCGRIGNVLACAAWNLTPTLAIRSRTTSSQATIYRHYSSLTVQWLWLIQTSPCAQQPIQAEGAGGCATLCPCWQCPLAQSCLPAAPCCSLPLIEPEPAAPFQARCQFWLSFLLFPSVTLPSLVSALTDSYYWHQS